MTKKRIAFLFIPLSFILLIIAGFIFGIVGKTLIYADTTKYLKANGNYYELPAHVFFCEYDMQEDRAYVVASRYIYPNGTSNPSTRYYSPNEITLTASSTTTEWNAFEKRVSDLPRCAYSQDSFMLHGDDCLPDAFMILAYTSDAFASGNATYIGNTISTITTNSLVKAIILPDFNTEDFELELVTKDSTSPVIDGFTGVCITDVDHPITIATLKSYLSAVDDVDGDITNRITISTDNYTANMNTVGIWPVVFTVSDSANNTASITIQVSVVDKSAPVIHLTKTSYTSKLSNITKLSDILGDVTATDNYDGDISSKIVVYYDGYSSNTTIIGEHIVTFKVTDSSGNSSLKDITITVSDDIKPIISGSASYTKSATATLTTADIKSGLIATDNYDSDITNRITEVSNTYIGKENKVGEYHIVYRVTDSSGNTSNDFTVTISVVDTQKPIFYINNVILNISDYNLLNHEAIITYLCHSNVINDNVDFSYQFTHDSYTNSDKQAGMYDMEAEISYADGTKSTINFSINVLGPEDYLIEQDNEIEDEEVGFFQNILSWFGNVFGRITNFFTGIWSWISSNIVNPIFGKK